MSSSPCFVADTTAPTPDTLYAIDTGPQGTEANTIDVDCERHPIRAADPPVVVALTPPPGTDLRDVLDRGLTPAAAPRPDIVVTSDPELLAYAARSVDYFITPLPWSATYVLVAAGADSTASIPMASEREALARDAVSADARGAAEPFAWLGDPGCTLPLRAPPTAARAIVAFAANDPIARQLAERIVSLAGARARPAWLPTVLGAATPRVGPLPADSITDALAAGRAAMAVMRVARDTHMKCGTRADSRVPLGAVPLVDSRAHVIIRRGSGAALIIGPDGSLRFTRRGAS